MARLVRDSSTRHFNTGLESSSCLSVSLEQLNEHICLSWTDQTIETDPRLELQLWLVLSFCELGNFRTARSEQHPIITLLLFNIVVSKLGTHFYLSSSIISDWASYVIGSLDAQLLILTYGANYPSWYASVIWQHSLCFYYKPCVLDIIIMQHHSTFQFWQWYWCVWHVASIMLIKFSSISLRYV